MLDRKTFYAELRGPGKMFPGLTTSQVVGMKNVLDTWENHHTDFADPRHLAYALATMYHETAATMQPIEEYGHGKGHAYGVPAGPWHLIYDGRGDVQLTWHDNYVRAKTELAKLGIKVDLDRKPELAMVPWVAALILLYGMSNGWFTGKKLTNYFNHSSEDPVGARHIVNGSDKAVLIAGYYNHFRSALLKAGPK